MSAEDAVIIAGFLSDNFPDFVEHVKRELYLDFEEEDGHEDAEREAEELIIRLLATNSDD